MFTVVVVIVDDVLTLPAVVSATAEVELETETVDVETVGVVEEELSSASISVPNITISWSFISSRFSSLTDSRFSWKLSDSRLKISFSVDCSMAPCTSKTDSISLKVAVSSTRITETYSAMVTPVSSLLDLTDFRFRDESGFCEKVSSRTFISSIR